METQTENLTRENTSPPPAAQVPFIRLLPSGWVKLYLPGKEYKPARTIGKVRQTPHGLAYITRRTRNEFYRNAAGWGVAHCALRDLPCDIICIQTPERDYVTTREFFLAHGEFRHYKGNDLELQRFLPLRSWGLPEAIEWENQQREREAVKPQSALAAARQAQTSLFAEGAAA